MMHASPPDPRRRLLLQALLALPWLGGCVDSPPLRIASAVWPGYELLFLARREGWLPTTREVQLLETAHASDSMLAIAEGRADGATLTLDEVLRVRATGIPLTVVLVFDISAGADVMMAHPDITTLAQIAGRRIGVDPSAVGALVLARALEIAGLSINAVTPVPVTQDRHLEAWRSGQVDLVITFEPIATRLQAAGAVRLFDSRKLPETIFDVLAVTPSAINTHATPLRGLVAGYFRALRHLNKNPQDAAYRMADRMHLSAEEVLESFKGLELPRLAANRKLLAAGAPRLQAVAQELSGILVRNGLMNRPDDLSRFASPDFLPQDE